MSADLNRSDLRFYLLKEKERDGGAVAQLLWQFRAGEKGGGFDKGSVGAARKVSPNWSKETLACHSSNCFSIVWGQGDAPSVTSLPSSCDMTLDKFCEDEKSELPPKSQWYPELPRKRQIL